jgi:hypothetical protein
MKKLEVKEVKNLKGEVKKIVDSELSKSNKIKELFGLGLEVKEISLLLNIRYNFAYNVISNYVNVNSIEVVKEDKVNKKDLIIGLYKKGLSNIEISKELKVNYNYVYKVIKDELIKEIKEVK